VAVGTNHLGIQLDSWSYQAEPFDAALRAMPLD